MLSLHIDEWAPVEARGKKNLTSAHHPALIIKPEHSKKLRLMEKVRGPWISRVHKGEKSS